MNGYLLTYEVYEDHEYSALAGWEVRAVFHQDVQAAVDAARGVLGTQHRKAALYKYENGFLKPIQANGQNNPVDVVEITPTELEMLSAYRDWVEYRKVEEDIKARRAAIYATEIDPLDVELYQAKQRLGEARVRFSRGLNPNPAAGAATGPL